MLLSSILQLGTIISTVTFMFLCFTSVPYISSLAFFLFLDLKKKKDHLLFEFLKRDLFLHIF